MTIFDIYTRLLVELDHSNACRRTDVTRARLQDVLSALRALAATEYGESEETIQFEAEEAVRGATQAA